VLLEIRGQANRSEKTNKQNWEILGSPNRLFYFKCQPCLRLFFVLSTFETLHTSYFLQRCCRNQKISWFNHSRKNFQNRVWEVILLGTTSQYKSLDIYWHWTHCCSKSTHSNRCLILRNTYVSIFLSFAHLTSDKIC